MRAPGKRFEIPWPFKGISEGFAHDDQPPLTTEEAYNVRNYDAPSGRVRGSKRPGRSNQNGTAVDGTYGVRELLSVRFSQKTVDWAGAQASEATATLPAGGDCWWGRTDGDGNLYVLNGDASIAQYSANMTLVQTFSLPVKAGARVGALDVDEGRNVFCGVSGRRGLPVGVGGTQEPGNGMILGNKNQAKLWKLRHRFRNNEAETEPELEVVWELTTEPQSDGPTLWGLVGFVRVRGGKLYTIQHDNNRWRSWLVIYDSIHAGVPVESRVQRIPYPASMLDVSADGKIVVSVESFSRRGENPEHPECTSDIEAWTVLENIDDAISSADEKHQVWFQGIVDKKYLRTTGGIVPEDGDEVLFWLDAGPGGRHQRFVSEAGKNGPIYRENGLGGKPSLWCDGEVHLMASSTSPTQSADFRDQHRGLFPTYKDTSDPDRSAQYAVIALVRPEADATASITAQYPLWSHHANFTNLTDASSILINRKASDTLAAAGNTESGSVSWYGQVDSTSYGEGTSTGRSCAYMKNAFANTANALLVSAIFCNGVETGVNTSTRSILRINGKPVDRFEMEGDVLGSKAIQYLMGFDPNGTDYQASGTPMSLCRGEWCELVVLDRRDLDTTGADSICTHPLEPDSTAGSAVGQVRIVSEGSGGTPATSSGFLTFTGGFTISPGGSLPTGTWASANGKLTSITLTSTGKGLSAAPTVGAQGFNGGGSLAASMIYPADERTPTTLETIEAAFAWRRGVSYILHTAVSLPASGAYTVTRVNTSGTAGTYTWQTTNPFYETVGTAPFNENIGCPETEETVGIHRYAHKGELLILMDASGKLLDVKSHGYNGIGLGCRFNVDGTSVYTAGNTNASDGSGLSVAANVASYRRWDIGSDNTLTPVWAAETSLRMAGQVCGIEVDAAGNLYVPCNAPLDTGDAFRAAVLKASDGSTIAEFKNPTASLNFGTYSIALPRVIEGADLEPFSPDYGGDEAGFTGGVATCEYFYVFGKALAYDGTTVTPGVRKYRMTQSTPNGEPPRERHDTAVANGSIYLYSGGGAPSVISGGAGALKAAAGAADYVHAVEADQKGYYTDGSADVVYDPKLGTVAPWTATHGELPPRCRILEYWRGRVVRTGQVDDPGAVDMSRVLFPNNWDKSPPVSTADQACDFATTQVGNVPDNVTGFVPLSDDTALIGAGSSLWLLRGDPMQNGQLDKIPGTVGMAFGRAWCLAGDSSVIFFGTNPMGVYAWGGGVPVRLSKNKLEKRLRTIDLSSHYIRMAYDADADGVWIMVIPYSYPTSVVNTYFYEMKDGAFWEDFIDSSTGTVTAITVVDGDDPDDRLVLTGHADGFVRYSDAETTKDGSVGVRASVVLGPYGSPFDGQEVRTQKLGCTLAFDQDGLDWELFSSDRPDNKGLAYRSGTFTAGANMIASAKSLGSYFWVGLNQTSSANRFALERLWCDVEPGGIARVRS